MSAREEQLREERACWLERRTKLTSVQIPDKMREAVEMRFGFVDGQIKTFEAAGRNLGVSGERVRFLVERARLRVGQMNENPASRGLL